MEQTIGNLGEEIQLHSDLYANLSQRILERAWANALYALAPDLLHTVDNLPAGARDVRERYLLLGPHKHHEMDVMTLNAFQRFSDLYHWRIKHGDSLGIDRFARLLLPNGQIAQSWWHEKKRPAEKVQIARNVKVDQWIFAKRAKLIN